MLSSCCLLPTDRFLKEFSPPKGRITTFDRPQKLMEEIIARIRKRQLEGHRKAGLIDVEPTEPATKEPEPEKKPV